MRKQGSSNEDTSQVAQQNYERSENYRRACEAVTAERDALRAESAKHEAAMMEVLKERDDAVQWADRLANAIGHGAEGEHSNLNNPWRTALEIAETVLPLDTSITLHQDHPDNTDFGGRIHEPLRSGPLTLGTCVGKTTPPVEDESCPEGSPLPLHDIESLKLLGWFLWQQQPSDLEGYGKFDNPTDTDAFKVYQQTSVARGVARNAARYVWALANSVALPDPRPQREITFEEVKALFAAYHAAPPHDKKEK